MDGMVSGVKEGTPGASFARRIDPPRRPDDGNGSAHPGGAENLFRPDKSVMAIEPACRVHAGHLRHPCIAQPTVSHHMKILADAGLVAREQRGKWAYYRVVPQTMTDLRPPPTPLLHAPSTEQPRRLCGNDEWVFGSDGQDLYRPRSGSGYHRFQMSEIRPEWGWLGDVPMPRVVICRVGEIQHRQLVGRKGEGGLPLQQ